MKLCHPSRRAHCSGDASAARRLLTECRSRFSATEPEFLSLDRLLKDGGITAVARLSIDDDIPVVRRGSKSASSDVQLGGFTPYNTAPRSSVVAATEAATTATAACGTGVTDAHRKNVQLPLRVAAALRSIPSKAADNGVLETAATDVVTISSEYAVGKEVSSAGADWERKQTATQAGQSTVVPLFAGGAQRRATRSSSLFYSTLSPVQEGAVSRRNGHVSVNDDVTTSTAPSDGTTSSGNASSSSNSTASRASVVNPASLTRESVGAVLDDVTRVAGERMLSGRAVQGNDTMSGAGFMTVDATATVNVSKLRSALPASHMPLRERQPDSLASSAMAPGVAQPDHAARHMAPSGQQAGGRLRFDVPEYIRTFDPRNTAPARRGALPLPSSLASVSSAGDINPLSTAVGTGVDPPHSNALPEPILRKRGRNERDDDVHVAVEAVPMHHATSEIIHGPRRAPAQIQRKLDDSTEEDGGACNTDVSVEMTTDARDAGPFNNLTLKYEVARVAGRNYLRLDCVGRGGSSRVYRVLGDDMKVYALKRIRLTRMDSASLSSYTNEIALLRRLNANEAAAAHIIRLIDAEVSYEARTVNMVMEYGQCDLNTLLQREKEKAQHGSAQNEKHHNAGLLDDNYLRLIWQQMLQAVQVCPH